ncbi:MAG: RagB/SusD family nutrient uptake outer membrane protein [Muribaculaceae bacterium]|nr:RagB/SusD family nutrient uptake outer membrane protein [Muribaculaceae bacterium]
MNIKKYFLLGGTALILGFSSCVGDLDLEPNDPNQADPNDPNFNANSIAMCYSGIAVSGISGSGSSYITGLDAGTSAYLRCTVMLNEYAADQVFFMWPDAGVQDLVVMTWGAENSILNGAYYRFLGHIAVCNQFLANTADSADPEVLEMRAEARVLRAYSYMNMIDFFGQTSFITEEAAIGEKPRQISRAEGFAFIESELKDVIDNGIISDSPVYGRVGLDGAEALLARLYLNAEVYSGTARWKDCQDRCRNIIARHQGGGFQGSGLANHWMYLFCRDNNEYMPGGANKAENEILFGIAYDDTYTQSYGGSTFIINSATAPGTTHYFPSSNYGTSAGWGCFRGRKQLAELFYGMDGDVRKSMWGTGIYPETNVNGEDWAEENYSDDIVGFTGDWNTVGGNMVIKFTGLEKSDANDGTFKYAPDGSATVNTDFASTDYPIIRLADVYLMYAECNVRGGVGNTADAVKYVNFVRERCNSAPISAAELTENLILDERGRELYYEGIRRTDLVRAGVYVGPRQKVWQFKGSSEDANGTRVGERMALYPIPNAVLNSQPDFKQNPGY